MSDATPPEPPPNYGDPSYGGQPGYGDQSYGGQPSYGQPGGPVGAGAAGSLMDRFLARLIDGLLLFVVGSLIVSGIVVSILTNSGSSGYGFGSGASYAASLISAVVTTAIYLGYFVAMESQRGQTVGKMVMKLHVHGAGGGNPTPLESLKRNSFMALPLLAILPLVGSYLGSLIELGVVIWIAVSINSDPVARRGIHDKLAETTVVKQA